MVLEMGVVAEVIEVDFADFHGILLLFLGFLIENEVSQCCESVFLGDFGVSQCCERVFPSNFGVSQCCERVFLDNLRVSQYCERLAG
jgi:hypothetical protein